MVLATILDCDEHDSRVVCPLKSLKGLTDASCKDLVDGMGRGLIIELLAKTDCPCRNSKI
jgi:hypothetical protein